ncbi:MAG: ABC transporter ATP-binding protein [Pseudomonas sp.]|uniref:ABC transporter ATP-binding protein n=1 Tax=Pseudomonas sp. TaxID=306 RepID=UPI003392D7A7
MSDQTTPAPLLELVDIGLAFRGVQALSGIGFAVAQGEICALIGPNGAGKSSLLNLINGVYQPQQGQIRFAGESRRRMQPQDAAAHGIARTFQNIALFKGMSVLDNVLCGRTLKRRSSWLEQALRVGRAPREDDRQREAAERVLAFLQIQPWRDARVGTLPYGLQKRVELARALAAEPRLLLLDEPMAGMNAEEKQDMSRYIRDINREFATTVVLIEHDIGVVMALAQHVVVLDHGHKIGDGTPDAVRRNPEVIAAYLGSRAAS